MTKYIRIHYLPWHSAIFVSIACLGFVFGSLTCLVLSAMAINGFLTQGDYPSIVMAQEAIILTMVVAPMGLSCVCSYNNNPSSDKSTLLVTQFPLPYIIFDLFALIFRVSTTGFYLKEQYFQYYSESKRNVYVLETSAVLIIVLLWFLSFPFVVSFYTPLFRKRASDASSAPERLDYTAKQYPLITFLITVEGWKENTAKDEESSSAAAAAAVPMAQ